MQRPRQTTDNRKGYCDQTQHNRSGNGKDSNVEQRVFV